MPNSERDLDTVAEEMLNALDSDLSVDDLTEGTEVYDEADEEVEDAHDGDPEELDLEPDQYYSGAGLDLSGVADAYVGEDDY